MKSPNVSLVSVEVPTISDNLNLRFQLFSKPFPTNNATGQSFTSFILNKYKIKMPDYNCHTKHKNYVNTVVRRGKKVIYFLTKFKFSSLRSYSSVADASSEL